MITGKALSLDSIHDFLSAEDWKATFSSSSLMAGRKMARGPGQQLSGRGIGHGGH